MEELIKIIVKEFEIERDDVKRLYSNDTEKHYKNGILEGLRLAEIIVKQQLLKNL